MIKFDYVVKVYTGIADTLPEIGNVSGVATWSTANQSLGILSDRFFREVQSKVDTSVGGNYSQYSDLKITIVRSALVETTMKNYDTTLIGKRIELTETDGVKTRMLFRGVIRQLSAEENETEITCSHLANSYAVDMTRSIGEAKLPLVFGQTVKNVKLTKEETADRAETVIGDDLFPVFVVLGGSPWDQTKESLYIRSVYDESIIDSADMDAFMQANSYVKLTGENSLIGTLEREGLGQVTVDGIDYEYFKVNLIPMNMKDGTGAYFFPTGTQVSLEGTQYEKIYFPEGITYTADNLTYKDGDKYLPFPAYVDSRIDYADRIEILDADNVGYSFVPPRDVKVFWYDYFKNKKPLSEGINTFTYGGATYTITLSNLSNIGKRGFSAANMVVRWAGSSTLGFEIKLAFETTTKFKPYDMPDNLYSTRLAYLTHNLGSGSWPVNFITGLSTLQTGKSFDEVDRYTFDITSPSPKYVYENVFPETVANDAENEDFRWENRGKGFGITYDLFSAVPEDWEKVSKLTSITWIETEYKTVSPTQGYELSFQEYLTRSCEYDTGELYLSSATGIKDISANVVTNTASAYKTTLNKQNYETAGVAIPSGGWGLDFPSGSLSGVIDPAIAPLSIPLSWQTDETNTKDVKLEMLRYTAGIGFIDREGREAWRSAIGSGGGFVFTPHEVEGRPRMEVIDSRKVYPEIGITYGNGNINVTNTEKDTYVIGYVTGVSDPDVARDLWYAGRLIYKRYRTKNEFPKKYRDVSGIINESDAVEYIKNQYRIMGVQFNGTVILREKYECTFNTSEEYIFTNDLQLGDQITLVYPNIAPDGHNGIIVGLAHGFDGKSAIVAMMDGDILEQITFYTITETGSQTDSIIESGSQTTNYVEG